MDSLVSVTGLRKSFGPLEVLRGISLEMERGQILALIGSSGSGKSTLLRCIMGLEPVDDGEIRIGGLSALGPGREARDVRRRAGMVFQSFNIFPHYTVLENVAGPLRVVQGIPREAARDKAAAFLARVHLEAKVASYPTALSGGQKQRVAIARALAMDPDVMLFDEPTSALDPELAGEILDIIRELASDGLSMLVATHQVNFVAAFADRMLFLDEGRIRVEGPPREVLSGSGDERLSRFLTRLRENA